MAFSRETDMIGDGSAQPIDRTFEHGGVSAVLHLASWSVAMMRRVGLMIIVVALGAAVVADAGQGTGKISGVARDAQNQVLPGVKVQLRNVDTAQLVATTNASATGAFEFTGLNPGNYIVEIVDDSGKIIGLSPLTALAAGGAITGLMVSAAAAAAAGGGAFFASTAGILLLVGIGAGVTAGVIAATNDASGSR
jgi:hypothetical protein